MKKNLNLVSYLGLRCYLPLEWGVGLMFFGVAEPLTHYLSDITVGSAEHKQQEALLHTLFHWGIHAWAVYGTIALALAYFGFRYKLPLALRSCFFYPLLKDRINGKIGDAIDVMALLATLFGIITTLGFGSSQLGAGLEQIGWISQNSFAFTSWRYCCGDVFSGVFCYFWYWKRRENIKLKLT